ncbi:hypothetical protein BDY24DRAFT_393710 [Mrakia frigida]|uniref:uncharacterized protein n=1 Tax=Mrakia frigida TaxID=29902 RepID=UPI003FCBFB28
MDWPPEPHKRKPSTRQRNPYQQQQHHHSQPSSNRQARAQAPSPPDLTSPILVFLALAFLFAYFYTFGLPIEIELNLRRLKRTLKRMGFLSWWSGKGGGGSVELAGGEGSTGRIARRRRGGELNGTAQSKLTPQLDSSLETDSHFPGLVNSSGAFCFLNSVLQAMAALPPFLTYISHLHSQALTYDVPSPLLDVLLPLLTSLSTPSASAYPRPLRLTSLIEALTLAPIFKSSGMFNRMREQQDAQELWQLLMAAVEEEGEVIKKVGIKEGSEGFRGLISSKEAAAEEEGSPFKGRLAYRRGCRICGYSEGIRLTAFDNLQLSVPRMLSTSLTSLLESYTSLDILTDAQCRKCRILQTLKTLERDLPSPPAPLQEDASGEPISAGRKKRFREVRREYEREVDLVESVKTLVREARWEDDVEGVKWELVEGGISTRQDMFSLAPPLLALHLNRSSYSSHYASKNPCRILFPSLLDLTPFCTTGSLSLSPSSSISTPPPPPPSIASFLSASASPFTVVGPNGSTSIELPPSPPSPSTSSPISTPQTIYRLSSAIYHLGNHNAGHYITYRRVKGTERWLRLSDEDVDEVRGGVEEVRAARGEVFMLFYELMEGGGNGEVVKKERKGRVVRSAGLGGSREGSEPSSPPPTSSLSSPTMEEEEEKAGASVERVLEDTAAEVVEEERSNDASVAEEKKKKTKKKKKKNVAKVDLPGEG